MKLTIEVNDELMKRVDHALGIAEMSREDALDEALSTWVRHMPKIDRATFEKNFKGDPDFEGFDWIRDEQCKFCGRPNLGAEK